MKSGIKMVSIIDVAKETLIKVHIDEFEMSQKKILSQQIFYC